MDGSAALVAARHLEGASGLDVLRTASRAAGAVLETAELRSVHHRPGRSVSHVYTATLRVQDARREVLLVAHVDAGPLPPGAFELESDGERVAVWRFPNDPFLPGLKSVVHRGRVRELLDELGAPAGAVALHTRAYRPSRRAVVEVTIETAEAAGRILYLKVLAGRRATEVARVHRTLAARVPVPRVVGVSPRQGVVAMEALAGSTLRSVLVDGGQLPEPGELLELMRGFAATDLSTRRDPRAFADPLRHVTALSRLVPESAHEIARVAGEAAAISGPLVPVHGDLHDGQLLLEQGHVTGVLDVDGAGRGLLAHDAGNLVAHVQVVGEVWPSVAERAERYAAALAATFRPVLGPDALRRATAAAWLGLATGPHRAQDPGWPESTRSRIARASAALEG